MATGGESDFSNSTLLHVRVGATMISHVPLWAAGFKFSLTKKMRIKEDSSASNKTTSTRVDGSHLINDNGAMDVSSEYGLDRRALHGTESGCGVAELVASLIAATSIVSKDSDTPTTTAP